MHEMSSPFLGDSGGDGGGVGEVVVVGWGGGGAVIERKIFQNVAC